MPTINRRRFLKSALVSAGAGLVARTTPSAWARPRGANEAVGVAVIGINNKGANLIKNLLPLAEARVVAICDVDPVVLAREAEKLKAAHQRVFTTTDAREIMERDDVDAVVIATSNHWHALLTVWACQAGKDVYVEKPVSHSVWEGRKMIEAATRYNRVVQAGTQSRSDVGMRAFVDYVRSGEFGRVQAIHALFYKKRDSIGRRPPWYPDWLDYDRFCGPAPMEPLVRDELHYDWHWFWATGNGDLGNIGIHAFDIARWVAGHQAPPRRVLSLGGTYVVQDSRETPNTQLTVFDYPDIPIVMENRGLPAKPGVDYMDHVHGQRSGVIVHGEAGQFFAGHIGGWIYDQDGKRVKQFKGDGGGQHMPNFLAAVRSRRTQDLHAPIAEGHASTSAPLFGNISFRLGTPASAADARSALADHPFALKHLDRLEEHLNVHGVKLDAPLLTLGPWLEIAASGNDVDAVAGGDATALENARALVHEVQRPPYVIPDVV